ncbi:hypothetical protein Ancab_025265 [Ancistrocladus abbreviatus]
MVAEEFTCRHFNLVETARHKEKGPAGFSDVVWSKTYSRVPETNNGGDATPDGRNSGDFEVCNNYPKSPISEGSRGINKASKSFKECGGIPQGVLNVDCALNEEVKEVHRTMRSDTRGGLTSPDAVTRKETEVLAGGKVDNGPLLNIVLKTLKKRKKIWSYSSFVVGPSLKYKLKCLRGKAPSSNSRKSLAKVTIFSHSTMSLEAQRVSVVEEGDESTPTCSSTKSHLKLHNNIEYSLQAKEIWEMRKRLGAMYEGDELVVIERIKEIEQHDNVAWTL